MKPLYDAHLSGLGSYDHLNIGQKSLTYNLCTFSHTVYFKSILNIDFELLCVPNMYSL